jgi:hypothetical protein
MIDAARIVAELRAQELLTALQAAVNGDSHWRHRASALLRSIADLELPEQVTDAMRAIDARKRAAEVMQDVMWSDCSG